MEIHRVDKALELRIQSLSESAQTERERIQQFENSCTNAELAMKRWSEVFKGDQKWMDGNEKEFNIRNVGSFFRLHQIGLEIVKKIRRSLVCQANEIQLDALSDLKDELKKNAQDLGQNFPTFEKALSQAGVPAEYINLLEKVSFVPATKKTITLVEHVGYTNRWTETVGQVWDYAETNMSGSKGDWTGGYKVERSEYIETRPWVGLDPSELSKIVEGAITQMLQLSENPVDICSVEQIQNAVILEASNMIRPKKTLTKSDVQTVIHTLFGFSDEGIEEVLKFQKLKMKAEGKN